MKINTRRKKLFDVAVMFSALGVPGTVLMLVCGYMLPSHGVDWCRHTVTICYNIITIYMSCYNIITRKGSYGQLKLTYLISREN